MRKDNIVLIGMPASGKSTVGVILAKLLGYDFIDTDLLIQRRENCRLCELLETRGIEALLRAESEVCRSLKVEHSVIATGGSAVYGEAAMRHLGDIGRVVYLEVDFDVLSGRLHDVRGRGVVLREGQTLEALYLERVPLYRRYADIIVPERGLSLEQTVRATLSALGPHNADAAGL